MISGMIFWNEVMESYLPLCSLFPDKVQYAFPFPDLSRAHSLRTMSTEEQSEPTKTEMDDVSVRPDDDHDAGCLQEESGAPATAATPTAGRADGFAYSQPQHGR
jgi:hypothetical protein